ncbi:hypothetical protein C8Q77DRAFT_1124801 [Trametes polyzona]|nr:hypothetical protein C8Q77DRAFT_1124801 [Trametes polyzona]
MDGNSQSHNGLFGHLLDPHQVGQVLNGIVRTLLPQHDQQQQQPEASSSTLPPSVEDAAMPLEPAESAQPETIHAQSVTRSGDADAPASVISGTQPTAVADIPPPPYPSGSPSDIQDVEMSSSTDPAPANSSADSSSRSRPESRNARRARVEDEDEEDYWRESNRQRMHSPTPHDDDRHHFMPIPEDHGVPRTEQSAPAAAVPPPPPADAPPQPSAGHPQPPPNRMTWTIDFFPVFPDHHHPVNHAAHHAQHHHAAHQHAHAQATGDAPQEGNAPQEQERRDQVPFLNFFINIPIGGSGVPAQPTAGNMHDGGNAQANGAFPFAQFMFPFGMDALEERDDPERAQRLVDGLEEVPVGLVKRMERAGGPGSARGETPTCAVCWESLLDPEGGGFEGNAELARAEAAQAAREDAVSRQEGEGSMDLDNPTATSQGQPASSPASDASSSTSTSPSTSHGEEKYPKIVVLPCSHVFHASCLLPWFSKPGRTTCPSCRFDIDPDSLTYKPRPLRARRAHPPPAPQAGAGPAPQAHPVFGPAPPPPPASAASQPSAAPQAPGQAPFHIPDIAPGAGAGAQPPADGPAGQPGHQHPPLPPFITFDISMIVPIFPGRPAGAAAQAGAGPQATNAPAGEGAQGAAPPPPRTDNNGFRLDDPILAEAVRSTFERIFGRPAPAPAPAPAPRSQSQPPAGTAADGTAPTGTAQPPREPPMDWFTFAGPLPGFPPVPPPNARGDAPQRPAPKRKWTLPPPPGPTLRQLVERNEREMGLRCSDVSCGLGPSDEDPVTTFDTTALRQISIRPLKADGSGKGAVCEHKFHPACLVSAERVAGWGGEDKKEERENENGGEDVEVSCPVCRAVGVISRLDWEEGACALA